MNVYFTAVQVRITLEAKPIASGGEGEVFRVINPAGRIGQCAKIYYTHQRTIERERKIKYISQNAPSQKSGDTFLLCFPTEPLYDVNGNFVGFLMPEAFEGGIQLYHLVTTRIDRKLPANWHNKYDRGTQKGIENRLKLCVNIAIAVHSIHQNRNLVLVDFKPQNVLITDNAKVAIIDLDSVQLSSQNQVLFAAKVATPEYTPKESERLNPQVDYIPETWDRFSMAIVFYELLFGLHPFVATSKGQYAEVSTIAEKISKNLFVHGSKKIYLSTIPPPHKNFDRLPSSLKSLFIAAFEEGTQIPTKRPSPEIWGKQIVEELYKQTVKPEQYKPTLVNRPVQPPSNSRPRLVIPTPDPPKPGGGGNVLTLIFVAALVIFSIFISRQKSRTGPLPPTPTDSTVMSMDSTAIPTDVVSATVTESTITETTDNKVEAYNQYGPESGEFVFWTRFSGDGKITIFIEGNEIGQLDGYFIRTSTPVCGQEATVSGVLPSGQYNYRAESDNYVWKGKIWVKAGVCQGEELEGITDRTAVMQDDSIN